MHVIPLDHAKTVVGTLSHTHRRRRLPGNLSGRPRVGFAIRNACGPTVASMLAVGMTPEE
jgi:hypothetical protein